MKKLGIIALGLALVLFAFPVNAQKQVKATQGFEMKTGESNTWIGDETEFTITVNEFRGNFPTLEGVEGVNLTIKVKNVTEGGGEFQGQVYLHKDHPVNFGEYKVSLNNVNSISDTQKKEMEGCEATPGMKPGDSEEPEPKTDSRETEQQKAPALGPCEQYYSEGEASFTLERKEYDKNEYLNKFETVDYEKRFVRVVFEPWVDLEQAQEFVDNYTFANIVHYKTCPETPTSPKSSAEEPVECSEEDRFKFDQSIKGSMAKLIVKEGQEKEMAEKMFDSEKVLYVEPVRDVRPLKEMTSASKNFTESPQPQDDSQEDTEKQKGPLAKFFSAIINFFKRLFSGLF